MKKNIYGLLTLFLMLFMNFSLKAQTDVIIGAGAVTGTTANGAATDAGPMYCTGGTSTFIYSKHHILYTASELAIAGIPAGTLITKIAWNKANNAAYSASTAVIFDVYMKNSSATSVPAVPIAFTSVISSATSVYNSTTQTFPSTTGWVDINLTTPFLYTGGSLEISTNWDVSAGGSTSSGASANFAWAKDNVSNVVLSYCGAAQSANLANLRTARAQIKITYMPAGPCTAPPTPGTATSSKVNACSGENFTLNLTGNSTGSGQTYQWQQSATGNAPWTNVGSLTTSPSLTTTQSSSYYYRCAVTCSGNTAYSTSVQVATPTLVTGVFTINKAMPTGSGNFESFADAADYIKCGINAPVIFNVAAGSGPYTEQVTFTSVYGTSATNTVTINGNGETLTSGAGTASNPNTLSLDGADYFVFNHLNIEATGATYGIAAHLYNAADNNKFSNCTFTSSITGTVTTQAAFVISGAAASATTAGLSGSGNIVDSCTMVGGYYNTVIYGSSAAPYVVDNQITNSTARDFYMYGIYNVYGRNTIIRHNIVERVNRTNSSTGYGIYLSTSSYNCTVDRNRVRRLFDGNLTSTSAAYCLYNGAAGAAGFENKWTNNLVSDIRSKGTIYGMYSASYDYVQVYHNTISLDDAAASGTTTTYGIYAYGTNGVNIKNNIVTISRGGTGTKYCLYLSTSTTTTSDNNVLYMNAGAGTNNIAYRTSAYATLAAWQTATSLDMHSVSIDPLYSNPSSDDYLFTEPSIDNMGAAVGVLKDIEGVNRSTTSPDPGAYETPPSVGIDMKVEALVSPALSAGNCYTTETITVRVKNNSISTINFATNPLTVTVNVTGAATASYSKVVNTGTLASDSTLNVTVAVPSSTINMSVVGSYNFEMITSVVGDVNPMNDLLNATRDKAGLTGGIADISQAAVCASGNPPSLTASNVEGYGTVKWQSSNTSGTGFTDIAGATTVHYTLSSIPLGNKYYRLVATCGSTTANSSEIMLTVNNPQITSTAGATRCGTGTVTLNATGTGLDINWYAAATGGTPIGTGNSFTTPVISSTTTYYAAANEGSGSTQTSVHPNPPNVTTTTQNGGLLFNLNLPVTLESIDVFTTTSASDVTITLYDGSNTLLFTSPVFNVPTGTLTTPQTLNLNWALQPGTGYRILVAHTQPLGYSSGSFPIALGNGVGTITGGALNMGTTTLNYFVYNMKTSTGCEGTRTAVTATVTSAPSLTTPVSKKALCYNAVDSLVAIANVGDFNIYGWSPQTDLFTNAAATIPYTGGNASKVYVRSTTVGQTIYTCTATNTSTQCSNQVKDTINIMPDPTIEVTPNELCVSGTVTLKTTPSTGFAGGVLNWQSSSDGVTYSNISGATTSPYTTGTITSSKYYKLSLKDYAGNSCLLSATPLTVTVNNPQITSTTPSYTCGAGTVTLSASGTGSTIKWYAAATGGTPLGTGNNFTTPVINTTTTYYVAAGDGGSTTAVASPSIGTSTFITSTVGWGLRFTVNTAPVTITSVKVKAQGTAGPASIQIKVSDLTDAVLYTGTNYNFTVTASLEEYTIPVNITITSPGDYKMGMSYTALTNMVRESGGLTFPYNSPGNEVSITAGANGTGVAQTTSAYYWFYNWMISTGCEGTRTPIIATVDNSPGCTVPVTYTSFTGKKEGSVNLLSWQTATEINNTGFELQRSADNKNFSKLDFIASKANNGNSNAMISYNYTDAKPLASTNYYRLKQIDRDGKANYSNTILLKGDNVKQVSIVGAYPNPTRNILNVQIVAPAQERVSLVVTDITGKILQQETMVLNTGDNTKQIDVSRLTQGTYILKTICSNGCESAVFKFTKN